MSTDNTFLESFIENVSTTLPSEIRRNLELMKDLDKSCSTLYEQMCRIQQEYVHRVEEKVLKLELATTDTDENETTNNNDDDNDSNNSNKDKDTQSTKPATKNSKTEEEEEGGDTTKSNDSNEDNNDDEDDEDEDETKKKATTSTKAKAKAKSTTKLGKKRKIMESPNSSTKSPKKGKGGSTNNDDNDDDKNSKKKVVVDADGEADDDADDDDDDDDGNENDDDKKKKKKRKLTKTRPLSSATTTTDTATVAAEAGTAGTSSDNANDDNTNIDGQKQQPLKNKKKSIIIPTTEEFANFVYDISACKKIKKFQQMTIQQAEEKVEIAEQTYLLIENAIQRLDSNIFEMEEIFQSSGEFQRLAGGGLLLDGTAAATNPDIIIPQPNDLAAIQVTTAITNGTTTTTQDCWILAKVINYDPNTGMFELSDEDVESNKIFHLPESQVIILGGIEKKKKLQRGDIIFAVYPDTTSFYQATIVSIHRKNIPQQPPPQQQQQQYNNSSAQSRRNSSHAGAVVASIGGTTINNLATVSSTVIGQSNLTASSNNVIMNTAINNTNFNDTSYVMVHFIDDSDEHGITHDKAVLMNHIMWPPYGEQIQ